MEELFFIELSLKNQILDPSFDTVLLQDQNNKMGVELWVCEAQLLCSACGWLKGPFDALYKVLGHI